MTKSQARHQLIEDLIQIYDKGEAHSIARIVFEDVFPLTVEWDASAIQKLSVIQDRLLQGEPIQYILGEADFYGLKLKVTPDVLIPRQETEELVALVKEKSKAFGTSTLSILDIGTGSGCIALGLQKLIPTAKITACDMSESALHIAQENAHRYRFPIQFKQVDILNTNDWQQLNTFNIIVSNPPYIPPSEKRLMPERVLGYEPDLALFIPEENALLFYRTIAQFAQQHLNENGQLFFEVNEYQGIATKDILEEMGFSEVKLHRDLNGKWRMLEGRLIN
ncbi:MAG: peptide chain release factor N(5)-glutamine methyltransferase [Bacteroidota bacterium]